MVLMRMDLYPLVMMSLVQIPECSCTLSDADFTVLQHTIDPLSPSNEYDIDLYEQTLQFLDHL